MEQLDIFGGSVKVAVPEPIRQPREPVFTDRSFVRASGPEHTPRQAGEKAADACTAKAKKVSGFNADGARDFILRELRAGPMSGEDLVEIVKAHGFRGHDDRCFGSLFSVLHRQGKIACVRSDLPRKRGHGTSGGKLWALA